VKLPASDASLVVEIDDEVEADVGERFTEVDDLSGGEVAGGIRIPAVT
jgi:hypothetical protein